MDLRGPCDNCPFLTTGAGVALTGGRWREIQDTLVREQGHFPCHKTVDYSDDGAGKVTPKSQHCAGALIVLERIGKPNQWMRIAERLGLYDRTKLKMDAPVAFGGKRG